MDAPHVVRELDWADRHWPEGERYSHDFPRVQRYCLMSTEGSFTDFHIDFGGSSVWCAHQRWPAAVGLCTE